MTAPSPSTIPGLPCSAAPSLRWTLTAPGSSPSEDRSMDINASTLRGVYTGLSTAYNAQFSTIAPLYGLVAMTVMSSTAQNEYPRLDDLPGIREWIGERYIHRLSAQTYLIRNRSFEGTIAIN